MKQTLLKLMVLLGMLVGLPMLGVWWAGIPLGPYLEFPPQTQYVRHAPFSWAVFAGYSVLVVGMVLPLGVAAVQSIRQHPVRWTGSHPFPWWGWIGLLGCLTFWVLAWTRFEWFREFQPHTFTPLWLSLILVINALCQSRTGSCMLRHRTRFFLALFPSSAVFWWFFEYLNRFVQNWHYTGVQFDPMAYFLVASLSFSTVLPAVLGMQELFMSFDWMARGFAHWRPIVFIRPKAWAVVTLVLAGGGLLMLGVWPNVLFALLWVSPLLMIVSLQTLWQEPHVLSNVAAGRWRPVVSMAMAAVGCGFFWELWNMYSLARWEYSVPFVQRFHLFEMPLLGYAGYLPFGLECAAVGSLVERAIHRKAEKRL